MLTFPLPRWRPSTAIPSVPERCSRSRTTFARCDKTGGYYCVPEVDIDIPFTPGMAALIQANLTPQAAITAMSTGHRYGGVEAMAAGLVDATAAEGAVVDAAIERLTPIVGKKPDTLRTINTTVFGSAIDSLRAVRAG